MYADVVHKIKMKYIRVKNITTEKYHNITANIRKKQTSCATPHRLG